MTDREQPAPPPSPAKPPRSGRIETQIHRRRTVKTLSPLRDEWDPEQGPTPEGLRTPPSKMKK